MIVVGEDGLIRSVDLSGNTSEERGAYKAPYYFDQTHTSDGSLWVVGEHGSIDVWNGSAWRSASGVLEFVSCIATDGNDVIAAMYDGSVLRTTDAGATWSETPTTADEPRGIRDISANGSAWFVDRHRVFHQAAGGSWTQVADPGTDELYGIQALSEISAIVCGGNGLLRRTTDAGTSWSTVSTDLTTTLMDIVWDTDGSGIVVGEGGLALATTDDGQSFAPIGAPESPALFTAVARNKASGAVAITAADGQLHIRAATGSPWVSYQTFAQLQSVGIADGIAYAAGEGGIVVAVDISVVSVDEQASVATVRLHPNPATDHIVVALGDLEMASSVRVVSVTGRTVLETAVNNNAGSVTLDVGSLPHGAYLVEVRSRAGEPIGKARFVK